MLEPERIIPVYVRIEPPLKWPLWFDGDILDNEISPPISDSLRQEAYELCTSFADGTSWCNEYSCWYWIDEESLLMFRKLAKEFGEKLRFELGAKYAIRNPTGTVSDSGHADIVNESFYEATNGIWRSHSCKN